MLFSGPANIRQHRRERRQGVLRPPPRAVGLTRWAFCATAWCAFAGAAHAQGFPVRVDAVQAWQNKDGPRGSRFLESETARCEAVQPRSEQCLDVMLYLMRAVHDWVDMRSLEIVSERADRLAGQLYPNGSERRARTLYWRAESLFDRDRVDEAVAFYRRALAMGETQPSPSPDFVDFLMTLRNNYSDALRVVSRYEESYYLAAIVLDYRTRTLPVSDPLLALTEGNFAKAMQVLGRSPEAEQHHRKALAYLERIDRGRGERYAMALHSLAMNLNLQGRYEESAGYYDRAVEAYLNARGADDFDTIATMEDRAFNLTSLGRYAEAEPILLHTLDANRRRLSADNPTVATSLRNLAANYMGWGRAEKAIPYFRKALKIRQAKYGEDRSDTGWSYIDLAAALAAAGGHDREAEQLYRRGLAIYARTHTAYAPERLWAQIGFARFLGTRPEGRAEARAWLIRTGAGVRARLGMHVEFGVNAERDTRRFAAAFDALVRTDWALAQGKAPGRTRPF